MTGKSGRILANGVEHYLSTFGVTSSGSYLGMPVDRTCCTSCVFRRQRSLPGQKRQHHVSAQSRDSYDVSALWPHAHRTGLFQRCASGSGSTVFRTKALFMHFAHLTPCPRDFASYLEIPYSCLPGE